MQTVSARIEQSQSRIEEQLQEILAINRRHESLNASQRLDASSPEGRQTWMVLGRFVREEGITPAQIKKHQSELVKAMKPTLADRSQANTSPSSLHIATEFSYASLDTAVYSMVKASESMSLLSSALRQDDSFPMSFTKREVDMPGA